VTERETKPGYELYLAISLIQFFIHSEKVVYAILRIFQSTITDHD
jgi:hypothetical protein